MKLFVYMSIAVLLYSCTFDKGEVPVPQVACDTTLTFSVNIQPLITLHCTDPGCHQPSSAEGNLTDYNGLMIKVNSGKLRQKVLTEGTMPPTAPLSPEDKRKIECWLEIGAPEN